MSGVKATLIAVIGMTAVLLGVAYATDSVFIGPVDCNPKGEAVAWDPDTNACYRFKASCKGSAQGEECAGAFLDTNASAAEVVSECGKRFCFGVAEAYVEATSVKTSCKWLDGGAVKVSLKRDDKLCVPCCVKPDKVTGCDFVCGG